MRFAHAFESAFSAEDAFAVHRDELPGFGPRLRGVRAVERLSTSRAPGEVRHTHRWRGDPKVLPDLLRFVVPGSMFAWEDEQTWVESELAGRWLVTVPSLGRLVRIEGAHRFEPRAGGAAVRIEGDFHLAGLDFFGGEAGRAFVQRLFDGILYGSRDVIETYMRERAPRV